MHIFSAALIKRLCILAIVFTLKLSMPISAIALYKGKFPSFLYASEFLTFSFPHNPFFD